MKLKEEFLHLLWGKKRFLSNQFTLTNGKEIEILDFGTINPHQGPDFNCGKIAVDSLILFGNIELHIYSSDWYKHLHHFDSAYENVILHVVWEEDKKVILHNQELYCLELKNFVSENHILLYKQMLQKTHPICKNLLIKNPEQLWSKFKEKAIIQRLERKKQELQSQYENLKGNIHQLIYEKIAQCLGYKINVLPFNELTKRLPFQVIKREDKEHINILLFGVAGFLEDSNKLEHLNKQWLYLKKKHQLEPMKTSSWQKKGALPQGFPEHKLSVFSSICVDHSFFDIRNYTSLKKPRYLSSFLFQSIQINVFAPLLYWYDSKKKQIQMHSAIPLLEKVKAEQNSIIKQWKKMSMTFKNSLDSQAIIEINNEFCLKKKCFQCDIGKMIWKENKPLI